jgi:hypothetical protein
VLIGTCPTSDQIRIVRSWTYAVGLDRFAGRPGIDGTDVVAALQPPMPFCAGADLKKGSTENSSPIDFTLLHDPLVGLAATLDPVLALTIPARKLAEHFVVVIDRVAIRKAPAEPDPLPRMIAMGGARFGLLVVSHDDTREAVFQSCPQLLQCQ